MKQASFLPRLKLEHGGDINKGKRKTARPFSHRHAIHVTMRASQARGALSMLTRENKRRVQVLLESCSGRHGIRVYRFENVGNHLHLLIKTQRRQFPLAKLDFQRFLKQFAGELAFQITGARKGQAYGRFWDRTAYSRIISWGRDYRNQHDYFTKNFMESKGFWMGKNGERMRSLLEWVDAQTVPD